jgi:hypothetical protein
MMLRDIEESADEVVHACWDPGHKAAYFIACQPEYVVTAWERGRWLFTTAYLLGLLMHAGLQHRNDTAGIRLLNNVSAQHCRSIMRAAAAVGAAG